MLCDVMYDVYLKSHAIKNFNLNFYKSKKYNMFGLNPSLVCHYNTKSYGNYIDFLIKKQMNNSGYDSKGNPCDYEDADMYWVYVGKSENGVDKWGGCPKDNIGNEIYDSAKNVSADFPLLKKYL